MCRDNKTDLQQAGKDLTGLALRLRRRGYVCIPLRPGGKHLDLEAIGYRPVHLQRRDKRLKELAFTSVLFRFAQEPPDEKTIAGWFDADGVNIGLVGGVEGLIVLDFDKPSIFNAWRRRNRKLAAQTPICKTPSGYHVLLRRELPQVSSSLHFGFRRAGHTKSLGGYVVCPPSVLAVGGGYQWLPGHSPFDVDPQAIKHLADIGLAPVSPLKRAYDGLLGRGSFKDH